MNEWIHKKKINVKLLIVDDSPEDRECIREYLSVSCIAEGITYSYVEADKGEDALAVCSKALPDCILLDHGLPDMSGLDFLAHLKAGAAEAPVPVVMFTGSTDRSLAEAALRAGAQEYLPKQFLSSELLPRAILSSRHRFGLIAERRRAQIALTRSETMLRLSQEAGGIASFEHDLRSGVIGWAAGSQTWLGFPAAMPTMTHADWLAALHPADASRIAAEQEAALIARQVKSTYEARLFRPDTGAMRHIEIRQAVECGEDGKPRRFNAAVIDVTEARALDEDRARQHELLRLSEQRFRLLAEGISDYAFFALDLAGRVSSWNKGAERIKGYRTEEIVGEPFSRFFTPEEVAAGLPSRWLCEAARTGEYRTEGWRVRKDGPRFWASIIVVALSDSREGLVGFAVLTRDLTERARQEEYRRLIVEASSSGMLLVDERGRISFANSVAEVMFGYASGALVGHSVEVLVPDRSRERHPALRLGWGHGDQTAPMGANRKVFGRRRDGEEFPVEIGLNAIESSAGRIVVASIVDITQRTLHEIALERSRAMLDQTGRIAGVGGWELDLRTDALIWSAQMRRIFDLGVDYDPPLEEAFAFYTAESQTELARALKASRELGEGWDLELSALTAKGRSIFVRALGTVDFEDGAPVRLVGAVQDITAAKRAELQLVETSTRLRNVLASASEVSIIATDPKLLISVFNTGAEKVLGYAGKDIIGRATLAAFHDAEEMRLRADELSRELDHVVDGDAVFTEPSTLQQPREWTYVRKDGRRLRVSLVVTAMKSEAGELLGYLGIAHDVTREKEVAEKLREATAQAERANMAKSAFLASMSHEIRTPMNGVIGFADLLLDSCLTEQQRNHAARLQDAAKSLLSLINDILDLSKIEAGKLEIESLPMSPETVVHDAASVVRGQMAAKGLELRIERAPGLPPWIEGDSTRLRQILLNLLSNALKFTDHGRIVVRCSRKTIDNQEFLLFEVQDTGIGIPADRQYLLFQDFSQVDSSTTRRYGGTGLGLSICRRLARAMGGEIGVSSVPGEGTTIWFTIALRTCPAPNLSQTRDSVGFVANPARVLVADDLSMNREIVESMLRRAGHFARGVENGRQAVIAVQESDFDLVLMDMEMPEMDGIEATRAIRRLDARVRHIPIVALTANAFSEDRERCHACGMNDFLPKPINRDGLIAAVAKWSGGVPSKRATSAPASGSVALDEFDRAHGI
jgi:PAS domain S-box-containing protein